MREKGKRREIFERETISRYLCIAIILPPLSTTQEANDLTKGAKKKENTIKTQYNSYNEKRRTGKRNQKRTPSNHIVPLNNPSTQRERKQP